MIDKKSEKWSKVPIWVKIGLFSISIRKTALAYEIGSAILALLFFKTSHGLHNHHA